MPAIKSPHVVLKLWKKRYTEPFLKNNAFQKKEQEYYDKACRGLERLKRLAGAKADDASAQEFADAHGPVLDWMYRFHKELKNRKDRDKPAVKKYFTSVGQLILSVEGMTLDGLDAGETEPAEDALADLDLNALDGPGLGQAAAGGTKDGADVGKRFQALAGNYQAAAERPGPAAAKLQSLYADAKALIDQGQFDRAAKPLAQLEILVAAVLKSKAGPAAEPAKRAGNSAAGALAGWQAARVAAVNQLRRLETAIVKAKDPEMNQAVVLLEAIVKNLTLKPASRRAVGELERYLTADDIITEAETPNGFGVTVNLRAPLLQALTSLKSALLA
jgi:hypothetical protein